MTADLPELPLSVEHLHLTEPEATRLLEGRRLRRGERVMDPKAQIVGEVIRQLRPPDSLPTPEEARGQFRKMVELLDEPPPVSVRGSDLTCPGPAGPIPLRLYTPDGGRALPLVLYFHGGGWMQGGLETHHGACGKLAAALCQALVASGEPAPAAQLLIYPSLDLGWQLPSHRDLADAYILPRIRVQWYTDLYLSSPEQATDVRASPLWAGDLHDQPAAMIVTAGFDPLLDDGRRYAERLEAAGTPVVYREFPGQIHAFISLTRVIPQGNQCLREAAGWLRSRLG
ncbi:acetyl esterase [Skermanella aerolata]|uniref:alpha/beta hydrolase fold domain-containing protein n=1 Tax=Skermanella aerolata TaxID=393310 RepID=UPI003D207260